MALAIANTFSGSVVRTPSGGEGLPKVCCRRPSRLGHLCSQCSSVCGSSLHSGHVGLAAGSSRLAYALRSGVCPARRRARRTASTLLEAAVWQKYVCSAEKDGNMRKVCLHFFCLKGHRLSVNRILNFYCVMAFDS